MPSSLSSSKSRCCQKLVGIVCLKPGNYPSGQVLKLLLFMYVLGLISIIIAWTPFLMHLNSTNGTGLFNSPDHSRQVIRILYVAMCVPIVPSIFLLVLAIKTSSRRVLASFIIVALIPIPISFYIIFTKTLRARDESLFYKSHLVILPLIDILRLLGSFVALRCYRRLGSPLLSRLYEHSEYLREQEYQCQRSKSKIPPEQNQDQVEVGHKQFSKFIISPLELTIDSSNILGEGEFGLVYKGSLVKKSLALTKDKVVVAVKVVNNPDDPLRFQMLLEEIKTMIRVGEHENIARFLGVTSDASIEGHLAIITEFCELSSLDKFLAKTRHTFVNLVRLRSNSNSNTQELEIEAESPLEYVNLEEHGTHTTLDLIRIASEVASGMGYLASKKVIHGDLAARNILLGCERRVKVADFGMAHRLYNYQLYSKIESQQSFLPWRWMPVEAIEDLKFSEESDVWSYGVVLWEIFTLGLTPFRDIQWSQNFPKLLRNGLELDKPRFASFEIHQLMRQCLAIESRKRPNFEYIYCITRSILNKSLT